MTPSLVIASCMALPLLVTVVARLGHEVDAVWPAGIVKRLQDLVSYAMVDHGDPEGTGRPRSRRTSPPVP